VPGSVFLCTIQLPPCLAFLPFDFQIQYSSFNLRVLYTSSFPSSFPLTSSSSYNVFRSLLSLRRPCPCFRHLTSSMHRPYPPTPFIFGFLCLQLIKYSQAKSHPSTQSSIPLCHSLISSATTFLLCKSFLIYHHSLYTPHVSLCPLPTFLYIHPCFLFSTLSSSQFAFLFRHLRSFICEDQPVRYSGLRRIRKTEGMDYRRRSFANQRSIVNSRYNLSPPNSLHVAKLQAAYST